MSAKSASGTRNTPKRNAAPQWVLLRMNESSSISGRTGAGCAGKIVDVEPERTKRIADA